MARTGIPRYYGLRIYLSSSILYFFLVFPFFIFIAFQSVPKFMDARNLTGTGADSLNIAVDSLDIAMDSLVMTFNSSGVIADTPVMRNVSEFTFEQHTFDSILNQAIALGEVDPDSLASAMMSAAGVNTGDAQGSVTVPSDDGQAFELYFLLLFLGTLLCYLLGFIYNYHFKRYFRFLRRNRPVPPGTERYCRKQLFRMPLLNSFILILPNIVVIIFSVFSTITRDQFDQEIERSMFIQLFYLTLVATLLEFLFSFYWQRHRVHIKYIHHIYTEEELRVRVFKRKRGKIRDRFLVASGMTTFLPLMIVMVYLILSLTSIRDLKLETFSKEQHEILIGPLSTIIKPDQESEAAEHYQKLYYVNAIDTVVMLVGIGSGILVSLLYLLLFIKWTNQDISVPLRELLSSIRNTRTGEMEHYTIVRTNDEIGELAEGYNDMTAQIHAHVENISRMNRELEDKVRERTEEVVMQKEEIEAQKEEIEAQLDLATLQRDTISRQKEQILDSIRYAEKIQSAILPPIEYLSEYLTDYFILFKPRDIVSGDYYWTIRLGDKIMIAVADCTGHGVPGAFLSMLGISSMNEIVNRSGTIHANQILEQLRDFVINSLHQTGTRGETRDGIEIALVVIDTRKKMLEYAGANRPLYLIRKKKLQQIRGDRMPIGIYDQETIPFRNHEEKLQNGDAIYLFSDGYVDQLGGPRRKTFRSKYFRQLLLEVQDHPMEEQKRLLSEKLESWSGDVEQIDDILVMGIKI